MLVFGIPVLAAVAASPTDGNDPSNCILDGGNIWTDWLSGGCTVVSDTVQGAIKDSILAPYVQDFKNGVADSTKTMATFWTKIPDPDVGDSVTGAKSDVVGFLNSSLTPLIAVVMVLSILWGAGKIIWDNNRKGNGFVEILNMLLRYMFFSVLAVPVIATMLIIFRAVGESILNLSTNGTNFADNLFNLFNSEVGITSAALLILVLIVAAIFALIQAGVMIARGAVLLILVGTLMVPVAASNTETGEMAYKQYIAWIFGFAIYQPAAMVIYAAGFRLMGTNPDIAGNGLLQCVYGIVIIILAIAALPVILRLVAPATAPVATGNGMGASVGMSAATMAAYKVA